MSIMIESLVGWPYNIYMKRILILIISIVIISCGNLSLETDPVVVNTIDYGAVLSVGDIFELSIDKSSSSVVVNPTSVKIEIIYQDTTSRGIESLNVEDSDSFDNLEYGEESNSKEIEPIEFLIDIKEIPNPQFQINSDFEQGLYTLKITVYEHDSIISEHNTEFIVFSGELNGEVEWLAPSKDLYTNSMVILGSKINHDDIIDPYLIWKFENTIIHKGYLSEGADRIIWDTADNYGFIDIQLDIFPYKLNDEIIESDNYVDFSFIVNPIEKTLFDDVLLQPYSKVLFFNGNYIDELNKELEITKFSEMTPNILDNYLGMEFSSTIGFSIKESLFPLDVETETPLSFSMIMDFKPINRDDGSILKSHHNGNSMSLYVNDGVLKHSFGIHGYENSVVDILEISELDPLYLVISFIKLELGYKLLYYNNGEYLAESFWLFPESDSTSIDYMDNYTIFGGTEDIYGFSTIIDSFKIYYKDENNRNNVYENHIEDRLEVQDYNRVLEGFNSLYIPDNLIGDGFVDGNFLSMADSTILDYSNSLSSDEDYSISIISSIDSNYLLSLLTESGTVIDKIITGNCILKKVGDTVFINDEKIIEPILDLTGFKLEAISSVVLDSITVLNRDTVVDP